MTRSRWSGAQAKMDWTPGVRGLFRTIPVSLAAVGMTAFAGTVKTVDTRDFWRSQEESPSGQGYHYNRNAETYMLVGEALGRGMIELLNGMK